MNYAEPNLFLPNMNYTTSQEALPLQNQAMGVQLLQNTNINPIITPTPTFLGYPVNLYFHIFRADIFIEKISHTINCARTSGLDVKGVSISWSWVIAINV